jgi:hypothetical protein
VSQSRKHSFIEVCASTVFGYFVAIGSQSVIFPLFDIHVPLTANMEISGAFMTVSISRQYCFRRFFNRFHRRDNDSARPAYGPATTDN